MKRFIVVLLLVGMSLAPAVRSQSTRPPADRRLPDFDIRDGRTDEVAETRKAGLALFMSSTEQAQLGTRLVSNRFGLPKLYLREGQALTRPSPGKPAEIAKEFLRSSPALFFLNNADIDRLRLVVDDIGDSAKFLAFNQTLNGVDVFNGQIKFTLNSQGEVIQVAVGEVLPGVTVSTAPQLTPAQAVTAAFMQAGKEPPQSHSSAGDTNGKAQFVNPFGNGYSRITAELIIFPMSAATGRLAYRISLETDIESWYELLIDASSGALLYRHNLYVFAAQARVWTESPMKGTRTLITFPDVSATNPAGWIPSNGDVTTGNNVDAFLDVDSNDAPDTNSDPNMKTGRAYSATQAFEFDFGDGLSQQDPRLYQPAAVTNLFYFTNIAHDYFYGLGFNEEAGNFQTSNFNRGGLGNDAIVAAAQFGRFTNNAAFAPTPDGTAPRLRMGLFTRGTSSRTDDLDSVYDGQVVLHEYGHGVTNRLVGAKTSTSCLNRVQSGAMGEGWSDYFANSFFDNPVHGAYLTQNTAIGVRRYGYESYPLTYEDLGNSGYEVHDDGEIWAAALWDLRKSLGAATADRLVLNGLKATPCNPSMTDARDAILSADLATNAGANRRAIWTVFARHGLGYSALGADGTVQGGTRYDAAFDLHPEFQTTKNPAIASNPLSLRTSAGGAYTYTVAASNPEEGVLNYTLSSGPANMIVASSTGLVSWTASFVSPRVKIVVTDGKGGRVVHGYLLPVLTALRDGVSLTIAGNEDSIGYATVTVPANTPVLQFRLRGGSGDADLLVEGPNGEFSLSAQDGNSETLSIANPIAGEWQIEVAGYRTYAGVSLTGQLITPTFLGSGTTLTGISGDYSSETFYRVRVPTGAVALSISTSGGSGDVDVAVRAGAPAVCQPFSGVLTPCRYDRVSANDGNNESIQLTNPAAGDWYVDLVGYEAHSGVRLDIITTYPPLTLSSNGAATTSTLGTAPNVVTGYATATVNSVGAAPYATAVFSLVQNGYVVSEVGVPAAQGLGGATTQRVFVEYRTGVPAGSGTIDVYTGLAIVNRGGSTASLTYTLRDSSGQVLATGRGTLPANGHLAKFVHQLREVAPDFSLPSNFPTTTQYGSLEIASTESISAMGLRLTTNQRGETLLTSTSVLRSAASVSLNPLYFPQFVDGGGYRTSIVLSNSSNSIQAGTIFVLDDGGNPLTVRPIGGAVGSSFPYSIPPAGTFVFQTDGSPENARAGWARVVPSGATQTPSGSGVFSYSAGGMLVTEAGIPSVEPVTRARLYVDKSGGHDTGLAIANPSGIPMTATIQAYQNNGSVAGSGAATLNLPVNGHRAAFLGQLINGLPEGFTGIADVTSSVPFVPLTLRSLTNGRGDFLLTTFPAPDVTQPAPTPIVFPQIADGAGYATQFIFISSVGAAAVNVTFLGDDGLPTNIERTR